MKKYAENLKVGTTPFVIRLRFIFLISIALLALLFALTPYIEKTLPLETIEIGKIVLGFLPALFVKFVMIGKIVLGLVCTVSGILIAIKDPAMTLKMFGGAFAVIYIITIADLIFR